MRILFEILGVVAFASLFIFGVIYAARAFRFRDLVEKPDRKQKRK